MSLPLSPPLAPQLARAAAEMPRGERWSYEEKLDGFRALAFVDGGSLELVSRHGRPLGRYFPELRLPPGRYVADGEIVVPGAGGVPDFEALQQRVHPAASRIARLARETPAAFRAFDLLAEDDEVLIALPFAERRARLVRRLGPSGQVVRATPDPAVAERWLAEAEGVVAKDLGAPYRPGERHGMVKVKRRRTLDCVVAGYRPGKEPGTVGALMLGLHDPAGTLRIVGHASGFTRQAKRDLLAELRPLETGARGSGEPSRWSQGRDTEWVALRPERVAEVTYDQVSAGRIRHGARLVRWRPDRDPASCRLDQLG
ncbi:MAG: ATP-dependent DNA ligase [Thermoleophilia bacterium]|nr:ATP-dependent DNA ligase [Thermoleophilia bacterium]